MKCTSFDCTGLVQFCRLSTTNFCRAIMALMACMLLHFPAIAEVPPSAQSCVTCHGPKGQGIEPLGPRLASLSASYLSQQVSLFQSGIRVNPTMQAMSMTIQGPAIEEVAQYFSEQTVAEVKVLFRGTHTVFDDASAKLVFQGDWSRGLPACATCHGPSTLGGGPFPRLVGQQASYLKTQMLAWQTGKRSGDVDGMMANVATKLSNDEVSSMSLYLANFK